MVFRNRTEAGRVLAGMLQGYAGRPDLLVLGLPRGGIPVAFEIATSLDCPMDLFTVRKLGVPGREELAMGAIASGGIRVLNQDVLRGLVISDREIDMAAQREMQELERRESAYRGGRAPAAIASHCVILVDDGLATGSSMLAAVRAVRSQDPSRVIVAVPVAPPDICELMTQEADDVICAETPARFEAVGLWYQDFSQTSDDEVRELYEKAAQRFDQTEQSPRRAS